MLKLLRLRLRRFFSLMSISDWHRLLLRRLLVDELSLRPMTRQRVSRRGRLQKRILFQFLENGEGANKKWLILLLFRLRFVRLSEAILVRVRPVKISKLGRLFTRPLPGNGLLLRLTKRLILEASSVAAEVVPSVTRLTLREEMRT